jgi:hypothetical protein
MVVMGVPCDTLRIPVKVRQLIHIADVRGALYPYAFGRVVTDGFDFRPIARQLRKNLFTLAQDNYVGLEL